MTKLTKPEHKVTDVKFLGKLLERVLPFSPKPKTHDFIDQIESLNYEFEEIDESKGQMTGYGKSIKPGDYIILTKEGVRYRVEAIDYYADPPNLWTALLLRV